MKRKHKQILIIWVGLLAGLLIFRGGWMTYAGLLIFLLDLGLVWWLLRCPHCGKSVLRRWTILSVILLVPGFVLQFLSRTVFVPEAGVIGGLLLAAGLAIQLFVIRCPECGAHLPLFPGEYCKYCGNRLDWDKPLRR